jgi:hypothetical protein
MRPTRVDAIITDSGGVTACGCSACWGSPLLLERTIRTIGLGCFSWITNAVVVRLGFDEHLALPYTKLDT